MPKPHTKQTAQKSIESQTAPSAEDIAKNHMATGGGEPIKAGQKWTTEKRVLQPRDPATGHFTYNADAKYDRKFPYHGKGNATPVSLQSFDFSSGVKKGDVVKLGDTTFIAIRDLSADDLRNMLSAYDSKTGEHYGYMDEAGNISNKLKDIDGNELKKVKLSDMFIKKQGRVSKAEKEGMAEGKPILGHVSIRNLSKRSKKEIKAKLDSISKGFEPQGTKFPENAFNKKQKENEAYNQNKENEKKNTAGIPPKEEDIEVDTEEIEKDSDGFYAKHKEWVDKKVSDFNKRTGKNITSQQWLKGISKKYKNK